MKITCCDASSMIKDCYLDYQQVVGFSATLKPFAYYAKLSGLDLASVRMAEFLSPFPVQLRKVLIISCAVKPAPSGAGYKARF